MIFSEKKVGKGRDGILPDKIEKYNLLSLLG
jgi:hypothetical protein